MFAGSNIINLMNRAKQIQVFHDFIKVTGFCLV